ncbi:MAG: TnsD family transposase, partial [Clostridiales bacterium]|nr:TnsD family transposase [Clostridiales bacterium]
MTGGFFPTPYPDECLYSVLCRYYVRCGGAGYEIVCKMLFNGLQNLMGTIYLPIKSERTDYWASPESGVTRSVIAINHTLYPYFAISYTPELRVEIEKVLNGGVPALTYDRIMVLKSRRSWLKYLRYCPLCAAEDIAEHGETYWHRKHQIPGSYFCTKHQIRLVNSHITTKQATSGFYPASSETQVGTAYTVADIFDKHKDKCLKIGRESEWLLENGLSVDWSENGRDKYLKLFRDKGIASVHGVRCDSNALNDAVNDYWSQEFLGGLFSETPIFSEWLSQIHRNMMSRFLPLQHILLMCIAKGSVVDFVNSGVSENPFGAAPFICENPICDHYHIDGAVCMEVRNFNSRAVGYFCCEHCGMRYKISKSKSLRGIPVILDYGHLWTSELIRCSHDKNVSITKTAEILRCDKSIIMLQKKKLGLLRTPQYDIELGPEEYYKSKVVSLIEEYGEVTYSLLQEKAPGAYDYLCDHHKEWLNDHLTLRWETAERRMYAECAQKKVQQAIAHITANPPDRQISYGYIAEVTGLTRDNLRSNQRIRACVDVIVENREDWYWRRMTTIYRSKPIEGRPYTAVEICRAASIEMKTYKKYRELFEEVVNELNANRGRIADRVNGNNFHKKQEGDVPHDTTKRTRTRPHQSDRG